MFRLGQDIGTEVRDRFVDVLYATFREDERVKAIWLGGSLGRGTGDGCSDIDFYVSVEVADFETFFQEVPTQIAALRPLLHVLDFAFRRNSPTERVWFLYFEGWPVQWRLDFHVHTIDSARGADPDQRRELMYGEWKVLYDPQRLLTPLPPVEAPEWEAYCAHVQERVDNLPMNLALASTYIKRANFWSGGEYLMGIHERLFYLLAIEADPAMMNDAYPRRFAKVCDPQEVAELHAAQFDRDVRSLARAALQLIDLFEKVGRRLCAKVEAKFPAAFVAQIRATYAEMAGSQ